MSVSEDGWPIEPEPRDALPPRDGDDPRTVLAGPVISNTDDVAFGRILDHQMVEMGKVVEGNRAACVVARGDKLSADRLPYHVHGEDGD